MTVSSSAWLSEAALLQYLQLTSKLSKTLLRTQIAHVDAVTVEWLIYALLLKTYIRAATCKHANKQGGKCFKREQAHPDTPKGIHEQRNLCVREFMNVCLRKGESTWPLCVCTCERFTNIQILLVRMWASISACLWPLYLALHSLSSESSVCAFSSMGVSALNNTEKALACDQSCRISQGNITG